MMYYQAVNYIDLRNLRAVGLRSCSSILLRKNNAITRSKQLIISIKAKVCPSITENYHLRKYWISYK